MIFLRGFPERGHESRQNDEFGVLISLLVSVGMLVVTGVTIWISKIVSVE